MPRRYRPETRNIPPDVRYGSEQVQSFINRVMKNGKRSTAARLVYGAFELIEPQKKQQPLEVAAPGKAIHGHEPCRSRADKEREDSNTRHEQDRAAKRARKHIFDEMRPGVAARLKSDGNDGEERQKRDQRDQKRRNLPAEIAALLELRQPTAQRRPLG